MTNLRRFAASLLCLLGLVLFVDSTSAAAFKRAHEGEKPPIFNLPDLDGKPLELEAFARGPLTIVSFWALWSPKSAPLLKDVQRLLDEFGEKGVRAVGLKAVGVNAEGQTPPEDLEGKVREFTAKNGLKFPIVIDRKLEQYDAWGVVAMPATAFLDKELKIVYEFSGHPTSAYEDMRDKIIEALGIKEQVSAAQKPKRERYKPASKTITLSYGLAKTLYDRGQFSQAAKKLEKVLSDDPKYPDAHALNGAIQLGLEKEGKADAGQTARESFAKAAELDATLPLALSGLAHFALKDGDAAKALELAGKALELSDTPSAKGPEVTKPKEERKAGILDEAPPLERSRPTMKADVKLRETVEASAPNAPEAASPEAAPAPVTSVDVTALLSDAKKALDASDKGGAESSLSKAIDALLGLPQGPKMKKEGLIEKIQK